MVSQEFVKATREFKAKLGDLVGALTTNQLSDGQLIKSFVDSGDEAAFGAIVRRHGPMVLGLCRRLLTNVHDAEDAFQATFLVLARKAGSLRQPQGLGNWLYGVAFRAAMKAKTMKHRRSKEKQVDPNLNERPSSEAGNWQDVQAVLDEELERLPDRYRAVVILCDLEGKSRKEAALQIGAPEGTLSSRLDTARKMLAKRLTRRGVTLSATALATLVAQNAASAAIPSALMASTLKAVGFAAAGKLAAGGAVSASVVTLTEGVLQAMFLTKLKSVLAVVLAIAIVGGGFGLVGSGALSAQPDAAKKGDAKDAKAKPKPPARTGEEPKKVEEFVELKEKLRKQQDEIEKIRQAMVKEIEDEAKKINESHAKELAASKAGDKDAFGRAAKLSSQKIQLSSLKFAVESGRFSEKKVVLSEEQRLGIHIGNLSASLVNQLGLDKDKGVIVDRVEKDSPAAKAGLKAHDIVLKVNGKVVPNSHKEFSKVLTEIAAATPFEVVVLRQGKQETISGLVIPAAVQN